MSSRILNTTQHGDSRASLGTSSTQPSLRWLEIPLLQLWQLPLVLLLCIWQEFGSIFFTTPPRTQKETKDIRNYSNKIKVLKMTWEEISHKWTTVVWDWGISTSQRHRQSSSTTSCQLSTHTFFPSPHTQQIAVTPPLSPLSQNSHLSSLVPCASFFPFSTREKGRCVTTATGNSHCQKKELDPCTPQGNPGETPALRKRQTRKTQNQLLVIMYQVLILDIPHLMQR